MEYLKPFNESFSDRINKESIIEVTKFNGDDFNEFSEWIDSKKSLKMNKIEFDHIYKLFSNILSRKIEMEVKENNIDDYIFYKMELEFTPNIKKAQRIDITKLEDDYWQVDIVYKHNSDECWICDDIQGLELLSKKLLNNEVS